jgi:hypothetical protein
MFANSSAIKKVKVKVSGGVFTREACIVGMVFTDCNQNGLKEKEELAIPGVRVYLQDGSHFTTDTNGQYSYCGLRPTTYVVKPDPASLPAGSVLGITSNANLGSAASLLLHIKAGELARADFAEVSCSAAVLTQVQARKNGAFNASNSTAPVKNQAVVFSSKTPKQNQPICGNLFGQTPCATEGGQ